jgi:hypothetical protein
MIFRFSKGRVSTELPLADNRFSPVDAHQAKC